MKKYVELNVFLRINDLASTGGQAKQLIRSEKVSVNGSVETRNKRKLFSGDKVLFDNKEFVVLEENCLKEHIVI